MSHAGHHKKLILVIGATGAQGIAVIDKLLAPSEDGSPSPYAVRALTRDPDNPRARELAAKGVECVKGSFDDFASVATALRGVYGAWVNTDGFTVCEMTEIWCGLRIFELAQQAGLRHYVYSALDYLGKWDPKYRCQHSDGKGYVADWMKSQPSVAGDTGMTWSIVHTTPYMDMLHEHMFGPVKRREDGTVVFASPIGHGHIPMIALADVGFFARYTFDNRAALSGAELKVASDWVSWDYLVETFTKVTGQKAEYVPITLDQWFDRFTFADMPLTREQSIGDELWTFRKNFSAWWTMWHDDLVKRDFEWIRKVNPNVYTLEKWMREKNYGDEEVLWRWQKTLARGSILKGVADRQGLGFNFDAIAQL
ncbi:NAD(P)-binding protein [Wolfiporia cocos MD-104 SS10]|uniref:NAD(P)-binding protein n=1 Tax=Wolfiporia cocos (strain MD-104) TaxID=742152 RepID=A0A2H3JDM6_WOLCO|nr:NAD(P)-binding protein [Wolfiporia cocos MD-104 SS10]